MQGFVQLFFTIMIESYFCFGSHYFSHVTSCLHFIFTSLVIREHLNKFLKYVNIVVLKSPQIYTLKTFSNSNKTNKKARFCGC